MFRSERRGGRRAQLGAPDGGKEKDLATSRQVDICYRERHRRGSGRLQYRPYTSDFRAEGFRRIGIKVWRRER